MGKSDKHASDCGCRQCLNALKARIDNTGRKIDDVARRIEIMTDRTTELENNSIEMKKELENIEIKWQQHEDHINDAIKKYKIPIT